MSLFHGCYYFLLVAFTFYIESQHVMRFFRVVKFSTVTESVACKITVITIRLNVTVVTSCNSYFPTFFLFSRVGLRENAVVDFVSLLFFWT